MPSATKQLHCAEVWGGNRPVDMAISLFGLDAWVHSRPHYGKYGGDVYYLSSCAAGQIARLIVADVAGHGQAVAGTAHYLRKLMTRYIVYHSQTRLVRALNRHFARATPDGQFATAVVVTVDAVTNRMLLTNAGHPPPLHFDQASGRWRLLRQRQQKPPQMVLAGEAAKAEGVDGTEAEPLDVPLGIEPGGRYDQFDIQLGIGDLVLCYTDSLTDALTGSGARLGPDGLLEQVSALHISRPEELIPALLERIGSLDPRNLAEDDVTVLVARPNGRRRFIPWRDWMLAPFRAVRAVAGTYWHNHNGDEAG